MYSAEIKKVLDDAANLYNVKAFIEDDPISIPHRYRRPLDIEVAGFLTAVITWGQRKTILTNADKMMNLLENSPAEFVKNYQFAEQRKILRSGFCHRTFNASDLDVFLLSLKKLLTEYHSLEDVFIEGFGANDKNYKKAIAHFSEVFFMEGSNQRVRKHLARPQDGSAAKRINMFLRWMVRKDSRSVDFGIWQQMKPSLLSIPLDVHSGTTARGLGLLHRNQNDWKAVELLDGVLRSFNAKDPVKYDFALFGIGVNDGKNRENLNRL